LGNIEHWKSSLEAAAATSIHEAVHDAYSHTCDVLKSPGKHKAELAAAGVLILGTAAIITKTTGLLRLGQEVKAASSALDVTASVDALPSEVNSTRELFDHVQHHFFDLDRTFFDTDKAYAAHEQELTQQLVKHTGLPENFVSDAVKQTQDRLHSHFFAGNLEEIESIQKLYPGVNLNEKFPAIAPAVQKAYYKALEPPEEAVKALEDLHNQGKNVYAFTAGSPAHTLDKLKGSGLTDAFDKVFTSKKHPFEDRPGSSLAAGSALQDKLVEVMRHPKDSSDGYKWIVDYLHINPAEGMMTGDDPLADVMRAKEAGLRGTLATWFRNKPLSSVLPDFLPDFVAHTPLEFKQATSGLH
jgi:FMN phosphatase YigB (HAD superfamily)